ncbi:hypothetical protein M231_03472 [Tremella mesenterica]|uniref:Uncharacterized protein n=1 Tax=Tremella mesenterica TaxID=5217 RepID=A0A4Q1BNG3_TREME|nr:hypothetical protein M231_03472 [Tremella mesenterica]
MSHPVDYRNPQISSPLSSAVSISAMSESEWSTLEDLNDGPSSSMQHSLPTTTTTPVSQIDKSSNDPLHIIALQQGVLSLYEGLNSILSANGLSLSTLASSSNSSTLPNNSPSSLTSPQPSHNLSEQPLDEMIREKSTDWLLHTNTILNSHIERLQQKLEASRTAHLTTIRQLREERLRKTPRHGGINIDRVARLAARLASEEMSAMEVAAELLDEVDRAENWNGQQQSSSTTLSNIETSSQSQPEPSFFAPPPSVSSQVKTGTSPMIETFAPRSVKKSKKQKRLEKSKMYVPGVLSGIRKPEEKPVKETEQEKQEKEDMKLILNLEERQRGISMDIDGMGLGEPPTERLMNLEGVMDVALGRIGSLELQLGEIRSKVELEGGETPRIGSTDVTMDDEDISSVDSDDEGDVGGDLVNVSSRF